MFVNLTPHVINVVKADGTTVSFPPSGQVARVGSTSKHVDNLDGINIYVVSFGDVVGLPDDYADPRVIYIVSGLVLDAVKAQDLRGRFVAPGDLVRDSGGNVVGCLGFRR